MFTPLPCLLLTRLSSTASHKNVGAYMKSWWWGDGCWPPNATVSYLAPVQGKENFHLLCFLSYPSSSLLLSHCMVNQIKEFIQLKMGGFFAGLIFSPEEVTWMHEQTTKERDRSQKLPQSTSLVVVVHKTMTEGAGFMICCRSPRVTLSPRGVCQSPTSGQC